MTPRNHKFWEIRSRHGRAKLFASPKLLWDAACEYFDWCERNPLIDIKVNSKDNTETHVPCLRPFTIQGLCLYLDCNTGFFSDFEYGLKERRDAEGAEFSLVVARIRDAVYNQKFSGAVAGFFNVNIIARDLGLVDKKSDAQATEQPLFQDFGDSGDEG